MSFTKLTNTELNSRGATTLPNQPTISAANLKKEFDAPAKEVVAPKFNNLIDELEAPTSASDLGATSPTGRTWGSKIQAIFNAISTALGTVEDKVTTLEGEAHTHSNKELLDTYEQTEADLADAVSKKHSHANKSLLDSYTQSETDLADAVSKKHSHSNKALLDTYTQTEANLADAVSKKHSHSNKALLDTYDQTNADIKQAVEDDHTHSNKAVLDDLSDTDNELYYKGAPVGGGGGGTSNYNNLSNKPQINSITLSGNKSLSDMGIANSGNTAEETIADDDSIPFYDYSASNNKKILWSKIKAALKTVFDSVYQTILTFDNTPLVSSDNPVKSSGIYSALAPKVSESLLNDTVGWVGKNVFPIKIDELKAKNTAGTWSGNTYTHNNVDFECTVVNGYVTQIEVDGTPTGAAARLNLWDNGVPDWLDAGKDYILSGCPSGGAYNTFQIQYTNWNQGASYSKSDYGSGVTIQKITDSATQKISIIANQNVAISNKIFKPMIRDARITDSTFEPYHPSVEQCKFDRAEQRVLGARNLMPYPYATASGIVSQDVTFTINDDKSIKANGTNTSQSDVSIFYLGAFMPDGVNDYIACCDDSDDSVADKFVVRIGKRATASDNWGSYFGSIWKEHPISIPKDTVADYGFAFNVFVALGYSLTNKTIKPFIKLSKDTYNGYTEPCMTNRELTEKVTPSNSQNLTAWNDFLHGLDTNLSAQTADLYIMGKLVMFQSRINKSASTAVSISNVSMPSFLPTPMRTFYGLLGHIVNTGDSMIDKNRKMWLATSAADTTTWFDLTYIYFTSD